jgi:chemotaxis signal transduction protein
VSSRFMPIELDSNWLLVDADLVREVLGREPWLPIPRARAELPGVVAWRGRAVPLVDLGRVLGFEPSAEPGARARTLIIDHERGVAAVPVDSAREVRRIEEIRFREPHGATHPYAEGELDEAGKVMELVNLSKLLSDLDRTAREGHGPA